jgi:hypothetical protein
MATSEELQRAHNEGEQWAKKDDELGWSLASISHILNKGPSDVHWHNVNTDEGRELTEAFNKGVENHRNQT